MQIGQTEIRTPYDCHWGYDPSWRHDAARLTGREQPVWFDEWIRRQRDYLTRAASQGLGGSGPAIPMSPTGWKSERYGLYEANEVFDSVGADNRLAKDQLEAMLLCPELTLERIGKEAGFRSPHTAKIYERLFFNIRDDEGLVMRSPMLRGYFARRGHADNNFADTSLHWKVLAFEEGADVLFSLWSWKERDGDDDFRNKAFYMALFRSAFKDIDRRLRMGALDGRSVVQLLQELGSRFADLRERGILSSNDATTTTEIFRELLVVMAPVMKVPDASVLAGMQGDLDDKLLVASTATRQLTSGTISRIETQLEQIGVREDQ